jgi:hypothetical protein
MVSISFADSGESLSSWSGSFFSPGDTVQSPPPKRLPAVTEEGTLLPGEAAVPFARAADKRQKTATSGTATSDVIRRDDVGISVIALSGLPTPNAFRVERPDDVIVARVLPKSTEACLDLFSGETDEIGGFWRARGAFSLLLITVGIIGD